MEEGPSPYLRSSLVRISSPDETSTDESPVRGTPRGAGVFIDDEHILTCAHVVCDALGLDHDTEDVPGEAVVVDLGLVEKSPVRTAVVVSESWRAGELDVALLRVDNRMAGADPARLYDGPTFKHAFDACGFLSGQDSGVWAEGRIGQRSGRRVQLQVDPWLGYPIQPGFSGGPVWDRDALTVVGIVTTRERKTETGVAFMLPIDVIAEHVQELGAVEASVEQTLLAKYRSKLRKDVSTVSLFAADESYPLRDVFFDLAITHHDHPSRRAPDEWVSLLDPRNRWLRGDQNAARPEDLSLLFEKKKDDQLPERRSPQDLMRPETQALVVGAPGCGKSTLLKFLALNSLDAPDRFPVFIELRLLSNSAVDPVENLTSLLLQQGLLSRFRRLNAAQREILTNRFYDHLDAGTLDVYLDGLDEVSGQDFFDDLYGMIEDFARNERETGTSLVVTMRPYAFRNPVPEVEALEIQPLTRPQVEAFVEAYYPGEDMGALLSSIRDGNLGDVVRVPLLLSLVTHLYQRNREIISNPLHLYERAIRYLVTRLDREKSAKRFRVADADGQAKRAAFTALAYARIFSSTDDIQRRFVFTKHDLWMVARQHVPPGADSNDFLADLINTPLLRQVGFEEYAFVHLTMQEYLAATRLAEQDDIVDSIAAHVFDPVQFDLEVLPMTIALTLNPMDVYNALDRLPESLLHERLLIMLRSQHYAHNLCEEDLLFLSNRFLPLCHRVIEREDPLCSEAVLKGTTNTTRTLHVHLASDLSNHVREPESLVVGLLGQSVDPEETTAFCNTLLNNEHVRVRLNAVRVLGKVGNLEAVRALAQAVCSDQNNSVQKQAVETLGKIGSPDAIDALTDLVADDETWVRKVAAEALGQIGSLSAIDALIRLLTDDESWVRKAAAEALGKIGSPDALDTLTDLLADDESRVRKAAAEAIGQIGSPDIVSDLVHLATDDKSWVRVAVAQALGQIGSRNATRALIRFFVDDQPQVREAAAEALGQIGSPDIVSDLIHLAADDEPWVRSTAAHALGQVDSPDATDALIRLLEDDESWVRTIAAKILGPIGSPDAIDALIRSLQDSSTYVKQTAIEALGKSSSPDTTSTLIHLLSDDESQIRKAAALALGQIGSHDAINALIRLLTDDESEVRKAAALALGQIGSSDATYALTRLFTDDESWDQNAAAQALQQIGSPDAVPLLLSEMCRRGTYTEEVRTLAGDFQTTAEGLRLTITSNDVHPAARALAVQHVGFYHDDEELLSILRDITKEDPDAEVRKAASRAAVAYWEKLNLLARVRGDE